MNRVFLFLAFILISFVVYGFYISQFEFSLINKNESPSIYSTRLFYDYKMSLNIYTNLSTGSGNPYSIAHEAKKSRLDYILLSDTNMITDLEHDHYISSVGVLFAQKINFNDQPYIIYSPSTKDTLSSQTNDLFNPQMDKLIIAAHPINKSFSYHELQNTAIDGVEVINLKSVIQKSWQFSKLSTIWSLIYYPFNPRLALMRLYNDPIDEILLFDKLSQEKKISFFIGSEATARAIPFANWLIKFPSYESSFSIASQHILLPSELTGDISTDNRKIVDALKKQRSYVAFDALGDSNGFEVYVGDKNKKYFLGDTIEYTKSLTLYYKLPSEPNAFYEVVLYKNGIRLDHMNTFQGLFKINSPGIYRIQVRLSPRFPLPDAIKWISWIYTNNFYITE